MIKSEGAGCSRAAVRRASPHQTAAGTAALPGGCEIAPRRGALQKAPDAFLLESGRLALRIRFAAERVPAAGGLGLLPSKSLSLFGIAIG